MQNFWYIGAESQELKNKPLSRIILEEKIVLFRDGENKAVALTDICPHRNIQLSKGKVVNGNLQCPYHGWEFNSEGMCVYIPSLCNGDKIPAQAFSKKYPVIEQEGFIWIWVGDRNPTIEEKPFSLPHYNESGWDHITIQTKINNSFENLIENFIDCPHTGYIHGGLFRTPASHKAKTKITTDKTGVIIDIDEETEKSSLLSKLLVKNGEKVIHEDRFILPSITQVTYIFSSDKGVKGCQICVPVEPFVTKVYVYVTFQLGVLNPLVKPFMPSISKYVLNQDVWVLENQASIVKKHGEHYVSTPADTANNFIKASIRRAKQGLEQTESKERDVEFRL